METSNVISFLNQFPGVKAELVAVTGIKISSVYFLGYVLYETVKGGLDVENVKGRSDIVDDLKEAAELSKEYGIAPYVILRCIFEDDVSTRMLLNVDNSKVLQLPF